MSFDTREITTFAQLEQELNQALIQHNLNEVERAYQLALQIHGTETRNSGESVMQHLLSVAAYVVRLNLDTTAVVAALLHESLEREALNLDELDTKFGTEVAFIVSGMNDLKEHTQVFDSHNENPENFRHLILNATEDVRILIIRLANKLHNSLSWKSLPEQKALNQANKTLKVYAPLCEFLGLGALLHIFEDKAFAYIYPQEHSLVDKFIQELGTSKAGNLTNLSKDLREILISAGIPEADIHDISFRTKNPMSTYRKVKRKHLLPGEELSVTGLSKLRDVLGMRLILEKVEQCYLALGLIHSKLVYYEEEFDDYILKPKPSGYKSIHTVVDFHGDPVEIQIRTREMHDYNEFGPASHIAYKLQGNIKDNKADMTWTKDLVEWRNRTEIDKEKFKVKAFSESIFVFSPIGEVIRLPKDSTALDYAFSVHTDLGYHYRGALVNNKMVDMQYRLQTGDIVQILTQKQPTINANWIRLTDNVNSKQKIRKWLKNTLVLSDHG